MGNFKSPAGFLLATGRLSAEELAAWKVGSTFNDTESNLIGTQYRIRVTPNASIIEIPLGYNPIVHKDNVSVIGKATESQMLLVKGTTPPSQNAFKAGRTVCIGTPDADDTLLCFDHLFISSGIASNGYIATFIDSSNLLTNLNLTGNDQVGIFAMDYDGFVLLNISDIQPRILIGHTVAETFATYPEITKTTFFQQVPWSLDALPKDRYPLPYIKFSWATVGGSPEVYEQMSAFFYIDCFIREDYTPR